PARSSARRAPGASSASAARRNADPGQRDPAAGGIHGIGSVLLAARICFGRRRLARPLRARAARRAADLCRAGARRVGGRLSLRRLVDNRRARAARRAELCRGFLCGAKKFGASRRAGAGALIGLAAGMFIGFPGLVFGPFIGEVAGELTVRKDLRQAARAGIGATLGLALGAALKLALAFTMIGIFLAVRFVT